MLKSNFLDTKFRILLGALAILLVGEASGENLRKFAEKATGTPPTDSAPKKKKEQPRYQESSATSSFGSGTYPSDSGGESFLGGFYSWMVASPFAYRSDDPAATLNSDEQGSRQQCQLRLFPQHALGGATVPYARLDYAWQSIDSDTDANDARVELGYKMLAFHGRITMYSNKELGQDLDISQYYGVLRYGGYRPDFVPGAFEFGVGFGGAGLKLEDSIGTIEDSSFAWTIILKYYPLEWLGFEFRPAWYSFDENIGDYDLSASLGWRYVQLRGGYRWMSLQGDSWNSGPYAGVSVSF